MSDATEDIVLELRSLYVGYYKDLNILQDLNVKARKNQITAILGANGVGKSTALKAVFGFLRPNEGQVLLEGEDIIDVPTHQRILKGLAYIPQQPGIFKDMSVEENMELGGWTGVGSVSGVRVGLGSPGGNYCRISLFTNVQEQTVLE